VKKKATKLERPGNGEMRRYFSLEIDVPIHPFKNGNPSTSHLVVRFAE
jgi:hypothetical protein